MSGSGSDSDSSSTKSPKDNDAPLSGDAKRAHDMFKVNIVPVDATLIFGDHDYSSCCPNCRSTGEVTSVRCGICLGSICTECANDLQLKAPREQPTKKQRAPRASGRWRCTNCYVEPGCDFPDGPIDADDCLELVYAMVVRDAKKRSRAPDAREFRDRVMAEIEAEGEAEAVEAEAKGDADGHGVEQAVPVAESSEVGGDASGLP